jgi:hypothetical protein
MSTRRIPVLLILFGFGALLLIGRLQAAPDEHKLR